MFGANGHGRDHKITSNVLHGLTRGDGPCRPRGETRGRVIMFGAEGAFGGTYRAPATTGTESPASLYVYCDDVDALFARATEDGAEVVFPPITSSGATGSAG